MVDRRRHDTDWEKTDRSRVLVKAPLFNKVCCQEEVQEIQQKNYDHRSISVSSDRSKTTYSCKSPGQACSHLDKYIKALQCSQFRETNTSIHLLVLRLSNCGGCFLHRPQ